MRRYSFTPLLIRVFMPEIVPMFPLDYVPNMVHRNCMTNIPRYAVVFFKSDAGCEPVREWLKSLSHSEKKRIGEDIKTVQFGWPVGMPVVKLLCMGLWEIRTHLENKIVRILFTVNKDNIILLHGFIKKDQKIPKDDLDLAKNRMKKFKQNERAKQ